MLAFNYISWYDFVSSLSNLLSNKYKMHRKFVCSDIAVMCSVYMQYITLELGSYGEWNDSWRITIKVSEKLLHPSVSTSGLHLLPKAGPNTRTTHMFTISRSCHCWTKSHPPYTVHNQYNLLQPFIFVNSYCKRANISSRRTPSWRSSLRNSPRKTSWFRSFRRKRNTWWSWARWVYSTWDGLAYPACMCLCTRI